MPNGNKTPATESIGERIARLRTKRGATQQEMAASLYVDRVTVSQWEKGTRDIKTGNMVSLAEYLDVSCDYLLGRTRTASPDDFIQEVCKRYGHTEGALATYEWLAAPPRYSKEVTSRIIEKQKHLNREIAETERKYPRRQEEILTEDFPSSLEDVHGTNENKLTPHEHYMLLQKIQDDINRDNLQALNELMTTSTIRAIEGGAEGETYGMLLLHAIYNYCHKPYKELTLFNEEWGTIEVTPAETQRAANLQLITSYCVELRAALNAKVVQTPKTLHAAKLAEQRKNAIRLEGQEAADNGEQT
ncbi:MAG: helix-turn-helix transcriptional regulator [Synergistaceae bacterium]|jgi:transcriptional regulator with XRE-family HTH domain|nr:helix-turn-helix transcriptional regulator [Synergistaceae bacterium]